jgi:ABC-type maltose transport system permease subunit
MEITHSAALQPTVRGRSIRYKTMLKTLGWYLLLTLIALATIFPFVWVFFTSFKGPSDPIVSHPPQLIPNDPTLANYLRVWDQLPVPAFFMISNSTRGRIARATAERFNNPAARHSSRSGESRMIISTADAMVCMSQI